MDKNDPLYQSLLRSVMQKRVNDLIKPQPQQGVRLSGILNSQPTRPVFRIMRPKVFVSFDYDHDRNYKYLLEAWNKNSSFQFTFHDKTPEEIQTNNVGRIKAVLTTKIQEAKYSLFLVGKYANQLHADHVAIGCDNWIQFEVQQSILYKKKLVVVLLEPNNLLPSNIVGQQGIRVDSFNQAEIIKALSNV